MNTVNDMQVNMKMAKARFNVPLLKENILKSNLLYKIPRKMPNNIKKMNFNPKYILNFTENLHAKIYIFFLKKQ